MLIGHGHQQTVMAGIACDNCICPPTSGTPTMSHPLQHAAVVLGLTLASLPAAWAQNAVTAAAAKEAGAVVTPS